MQDYLQYKINHSLNCFAVSIWPVTYSGINCFWWHITDDFLIFPKGLTANMASLFTEGWKIIDDFTSENETTQQRGILGNSTDSDKIWILHWCHTLRLACIQLSAIITGPSITRYRINNCRNWGRIAIKCWIHKRYPYLALTGELWGVFWPIFYI